MLLYHLVRKDILIVRNMVLASLAFIALIPLLIKYLLPPVPAVLPLLYTTVIAELMILQAISQEEGKQPKTLALLCSTPYRRNSIVYAKYILFFLIFIYCVALQFGLQLILDPINLPNVTAILTALLVVGTIFSIYMPLELKYGFIKAKFVFTLVILTLSMGPALFGALFKGVTLDFSFFASISPLFWNLMLLMANVLIIGLSLIYSVRIFANKEL